MQHIDLMSTGAQNQLKFRQWRDWLSWAAPAVLTADIQYLVLHQGKRRCAVAS